MGACSYEQLAFQNYLQTRGFTTLGNGAFGIVFGHPQWDRVIKVAAYAPLWEAYVRWAAETGWAGGYAPRVYSFKRFKQGGFVAAVMERLDCISTGDHETLLHQLGRCTADWVWSFAPDPPPDMRCFGKLFQAKFGRALDLGYSNAMIRPRTGQIVLTDPMAEFGVQPSHSWKVKGCIVHIKVHQW